MGEKARKYFIFFKNVVLRMQAVESIVSFSFIWAAIFSTPSFRSMNYSLQLDMRSFNATLDGQAVTLQEAGLQEGYRLGPFGYCGGHFIKNSFHEDSCVDVNGLEMDLNMFFHSQTNATVPTPEISGQKRTSKFLHDGMIAAASFSLVCLILDLFILRFVQSVGYTPAKMKLSLLAMLASIMSQTVVWTVMCAASTKSLGLAINIDEGFWELDPYPGIVVTVGVTFFVLIRISFTFGLVSSVAKSMLVISYYRMRSGNKKLQDVAYYTYNVDSVDKYPQETNEGDNKDPDMAVESPKTEKLVYVLLSGSK